MTTTNIARRRNRSPKQSPAASSPASPTPPTPGTDLQGRLVAELIQLVNDKVMPFDAGNALLAALRLRALPPGRPFTYRVPVAVPCQGRSPAAIFRDAQDTIAYDTAGWRHTRVDGYPDGYAIEELQKRSGGQPLFHVLTDLRLTVTPTTYPSGQALTTATALLADDLATLQTFTVRADKLRLWNDDVEEADGLDEDDIVDSDDPRTTRYTPSLAGDDYDGYDDLDAEGTDLADARRARRAREFDGGW